MTILRYLLVISLTAACPYTVWNASAGDDVTKYLLQAELPADATSHVTVKLEVGGELIATEEDAQEASAESVPLKVQGNFDYRERMIHWSSDVSETARAVRRYDTATAHLEIKDQETDRQLPDNRRELIAEARDGLATLAMAAGSLTRDQLDLVNVVGNSLVLDRLLPGTLLSEGEQWTHEAATLQALLGMERVAVCDVTSVVTEKEQRQVKIRLAGTVHGTVDGAPTEMELRGAYLFDLDAKRITRFNLAVRENRKPSEIAPGVDVVAKVFVTVIPEAQSLAIAPRTREIAEQVTQPLTRLLSYETPETGFRFQYDPAWYITAEERGLISLRYLHEYELAAHCNVNVLPPRSAGRHTTMEQFEKDVRTSLGDQLETIRAATEWETSCGNRCLGVVAEGKVNEVPIEWRYYLVSADDCPRVSLAITLEQSDRENFADAERQIIESLELVPRPSAEPSTAQVPQPQTR